MKFQKRFIVEDSQQTLLRLSLPPTTARNTHFNIFGSHANHTSFISLLWHKDVPHQFAQISTVDKITGKNMITHATEWQLLYALRGMECVQKILWIGLPQKSCACFDDIVLARTSVVPEIDQYHVRPLSLVRGQLNRCWQKARWEIEKIAGDCVWCFRISVWENHISNTMCEKCDFYPYKLNVRIRSCYN